MRRAPIDGVVFDLDGTLTAPGHIDFPGIRRDIRCPPGMDILGWIDHLAAADPPAALAAWEVVEAYETRALAAVAPADGVYALVEALGSRALPLGILTRNSRRTLALTLDRLGLKEAFPHRIAREDAPPKPDPAGVIQLAEAFGLPPARILVVGDYIHDVNAGHRAGAWTAWIRTRADEAIPPAADFALTHLAQVVGILDGDGQSWAPPVKISQRGP